ncbi:MAG: N-6 DNA methylase [Lachnospiraceae bacterium]|nr:N-6 DNA methylase [Lachnospiraceae bacterium]
MITKEEYERLRKIDTSIVYNGLREAVSKKMRFIEEEYIIVSAYVLYFLQKYPDKEYADVDAFKMDYFDDDAFQGLFYNTHHLLDQAYYDDDISGWDDIVSLKGKYKQDELAACVLFGNHNSVKDVPAGLDAIIHESLGIQDKNTVLDISACNGSFLAGMEVNYPKNKYVGLFARSEDHHEGVIAYIRNRLLEGKIVYDDETEDNFKTRVDRIFYNSEISLLNQIHPRFQTIENFTEKHSNPWKMAGIIPNYLKKNGKGSIIIANNYLSNREDQEVREFLVKNGMIEKVIALPDKLLNDKQTSIVVISSGNKTVRFISAQRQNMSRRRRERRVDTLDEGLLTGVLDDLQNGYDISIEDISNQNYDLSPLRYIAIDQYQNSIGDVDTETFESLGLRVQRASQKNLIDIEVQNGVSSLQCVMAGDIVDGVIIGPLKYVNDECIGTESKFILRKNDLLITRNGNPFKVAVYTGENNKVMACGGLYIVRTNIFDADPYYLKAYFESEQGLELLKQYSQVSANSVRSIMKSDLITIPIPYPDIEIRNQIAARCQEIVESIEKKHKEISDYKVEMNQLFSVKN